MLLCTVNVPNLQLVLLYANQHVDCVVDFDAGGVNFLKIFFTKLAELTLDRVKPV